MKKEVKIALVAILGIIVLFFGLNFLKGLSLFSNEDSYVLTFKNVAGVEKNTPVYADGVRVGRVTGIDYDYSHNEPTRLTIAVDRMMRIPLGSTAEVASDLMSNTSVNLLLANNPREKVMPGDIIPGNEEDGTIERLKAMLPAVEAIVPKLDSIMSSLNQLLADPALKATIHNAETVSANLTTTSQQLNTLMVSLNKSVPGIMQKADGVLDNAQTISSNLAALDINQTMQQVNATLAGVNQTVGKINSAEGTLGKLINDPELYNHINTTVADADALVTDLKQNPKRYVHFSVFGKKDK